MDAMTAIFFLLLTLLVMAALAPWFGSDSRRLSTDGRTDFYPAIPSDPGAMHRLS